MKTIWIVLAFVMSCQFVSAQQLSYSDPVVAYNRLLVEKYDGTYRRVGNYKVVGSPFLFGEKHAGNLFAKGETAFNIRLSYNAYSQEVEFYSSSNPGKPLMKEASLVDSFELKANKDLEMQNMKFIYAPHAGVDEQIFLHEIYRGPKYSIYKRYNVSLGVVSTNYVQAELRQFDFTPQYIYKVSGEPGYKILKMSPGSIVKEFKKVKDLSATFGNEDLMIRRDETLRTIFEALNQ